MSDFGEAFQENLHGDRHHDRHHGGHHGRHRQCKSNEVWENGVCTQRIGYGNRHRRHEYGYGPNYNRRRPVVYTQPVIYRQPVVYRTGDSEPASFWDTYSNYIWIAIFISLIIFLVTVMSNLQKR